MELLALKVCVFKIFAGLRVEQIYSTIKSVWE